MRIVLDSNILFAYFWGDSVFREICKSGKLELFAPEYALTELKRYDVHIRKKTRISKEEFESLRKEMAEKIIFIAEEDYKEYFGEIIESWAGLAEEVVSEISDDIDFLAVANFLCCPLWSNDKLLKRQDEVLVMNTKEIIELVEFG